MPPQRYVSPSARCKHASCWCTLPSHCGNPATFAAFERLNSFINKPLAPLLGSRRETMRSEPVWYGMCQRVVVAVAV